MILASDFWFFHTVNYAEIEKLCVLLYRLFTSIRVGTLAKYLVYRTSLGTLTSLHTRFRFVRLSIFFLLFCYFCLESGTLSFQIWATRVGFFLLFSLLNCNRECLTVTSLFFLCLNSKRGLPSSTSFLLPYPSASLIFWTWLDQG